MSKQPAEKIKDRVLTPTKEAIKAKWNNKLTSPLKIGDKVVVHQEQSGVPDERYIRIKHNGCISILSKHYFQTLTGIKLSSKLI